MNFLKIALLLSLSIQVYNCETIKLSEGNYYNYSILFDDISTYNTHKWSKRDLTWHLANSSSVLGYQNTFNIINRAFKEWESISILKFRHIKNIHADILIYFFPKNHKISDSDYHFRTNEVLAHAFYPENGDIHFNDEIDWSFSQDNGTSLYFVAIHEIGHAIGLNHVMDVNSILFPLYTAKGDEFKLSDSEIDKAMIKEKYKNLENYPNYETTTINPYEKKPFEKNLTGFNESVYPGFECLEAVNWCEDDLNFTNIFSLDNNLYLYKNNIFWILSKNSNGLMQISRQKFNHEIYFNEKELKNDLISVVKIHSTLVMFRKDKVI